MDKILNGITFDKLQRVNSVSTSPEIKLSIGNFITILNSGDFIVGERYLQNGIVDVKLTRYNADGSIEKVGY